jgi:IBR domain, a half RING-finger domain
LQKKNLFFFFKMQVNDELRVSNERPKVEKMVSKLSTNETCAQVDAGTLGELKQRLNDLIAMNAGGDQLKLAEAIRLYEQLSEAEVEYRRQQKLAGVEDAGDPPLRFSCELSLIVHSDSESDSESESESESDYYEDDNEEEEEEEEEEEDENDSKQKSVALELCQICFDEDIDGARVCTFRGCEHSYCVDCVADMCSTIVAEGRIDDLRCPSPECRRELDYDDVRAVLSDEMVAKYEDFSFFAGLLQFQRAKLVRWCPTPGCDTVMSPDNVEAPRVLRCEECERSICALCLEREHSGTCKDFARWKRKNSSHNKDASRWQRAHTRPCPNCGAPISKNGGCQYVLQPFKLFQRLWY